MKKTNKKAYKKIALVLSLFAVIIWLVLGTGASLARFTDTSNEVNNIFHFSDFNFKVSHELTDGNWEEVDSQTKIFDENALYEPGYVQVVYLKTENLGSLDLKLSTTVNVNGCSESYNVFGQRFMLYDHLKFGITISDTYEEMKESVADRATAVSIATEPLQRYYDPSKYFEVGADTIEGGKAKYIALVIQMPKEVNNVANHRGDTVPHLELGLTLKAEQTQNR